MTYRPGQTVWIDTRWPLRADAVMVDGVVELTGARIDVTAAGDALVLAVQPGPVRETVKHTRFGSETKKDFRGTALMLLLPQGTFGWIKSDSNYPPVTSE